MSSNFDLTKVRDGFPALEQDQVYFDNAGGSQTLGTVIDSISKYLSRNNVQLGASYKIGKASTEHYDEGYKAAAKYINADTSEIVCGGSTTQLLRNLSQVLHLPPGSELILSKHDHEANIASWVALAEQRDFTIKWWHSPPGTADPKHTVESLKPLLSDKTKLVACTHASNILGTITDIKAIADAVHAVPGAMLCVDGVAYAPHRRVDVKALGVDFYVFSWYKVYGPHISMLYASSSVLPTLGSLAHFFNPSTTLNDKLGLAAANYELVQSLPTVLSYLQPDPSNPDAVYDGIAAHEEELQKVLLDYLNSKPDVFTVFGETSADLKVRVPTVSFAVKGRGSRSVVEGMEAKGTTFGFRWGHFYSKRLVEEVLGCNEEGVVRVSMVHYNTVDEIERFVKELDAFLFPK